MIVNIQKIYRNNTTKDGKPIMSKDGKTQLEKVALITKEYGSKYITGFSGMWNRDWKIGDEVEVEIYENGEYINFKRPDPLKDLEERVAKLEQEVWITSKEPKDAPETPKNTDTDDINEEADTISSENIPF